MIYELLDSILNSITFAIIIGGLLTGLFGFNQYKKQKIWENIDKRYFNNGIESLIDYLNNVRIITEKNYENTIKTLSYFKTLEEKDFQNWFENSRTDIETISSNMPKSFFIVREIFQSRNFDTLCIDIFTRCGAVNDFLISGISLTLNKFIKDPASLKLNKEELRNNLKQAADKAYYRITKESYLHNIIENLEKILFRIREMNIGSYVKLKKIKENKKVKELLLKFDELKIKPTTEFPSEVDKN